MYGRCCLYDCWSRRRWKLDPNKTTQKSVCLLQFFPSTSDTICLFPISFLIFLKEKYKSASWLLWPFSAYKEWGNQDFFCTWFCTYTPSLAGLQHVFSESHGFLTISKMAEVFLKFPKIFYEDSLVYTLILSVNVKYCCQNLIKIFMRLQMCFSMWITLKSRD